LHDLHHHAGWPSLRTLARETGVSHTTVSKTLSAAALPNWGILELLVEAMHGDSGHFHDLWLAASAPASPKIRTGTPLRIAGRRAELADVRLHLETGSGLLLVAGEAGIGKTALLRAATGATGTFVAAGHCLPLAAEVPLMPVIDVLAAIHEVDDGEWLKEALVDTPTFVGQSLARLLPQLGDQAPAAGTDEFARQHLFASIATALARLADLRPLAVLIEDLHWADTATLDLLEHVLGGSAPVAIVGAWRTEDDTTPSASLDWFARVQRLRDVTVLRLRPLTRDETDDQLALLGVHAPERLASIHSRTLGQPLFTEQLAAHLDDDHGLPDLLADLLDRRLDGLTEPAWVVLRTLGAAERPLAPAQLAAATALQPEQLTQQLHALRTKRLVRPSSDELVHLQHPLLAEATQRRLVPGEGPSVHRSLAELLGAGPEPPAAEVANHWRRAGDRERELEWRVRAARSSAAAYEWAQEAEHWLRVLELWPPAVVSAGDPSVTRAQAYLGAIDALKYSLQSDRAAAMSAAAEVELGAVDDATRAELLWREADFRGDREGSAVGLALIDRSLEIFARVPEGPGHLRALNHRRLLLHDLGRYEESIATVRAAVEVAQRVGDPRQHRHHLDTLAWHEGAAAGDARTTLDLLAQARALLPEHADPLGDIRSAVMATDVLLTCGRPLDEVEEAARPGLEVARAWGMDSVQSMMLSANLATARLRAGRVAEADALIAVRGDQPPDLAHWPLELLRADIEMRQGRVRQAAERIHIVFGEVTTDDEIDLEALCEVAEVDFWSGATHLTLPRLLHDLELVVESHPVREIVPALVAAARAVAEEARRRRAEREAAHSRTRDILTRINLRLDGPDRRDPYLRAHLATAEAEISRTENHHHPGPWTQAASAWDALQRPHDAAYCRWRAAQASAREGQGTVAARLLKRAATEAREHVPLSSAIARTAAST
jgi:tetratricopeptide (TPR) repeat protein